MVSLQDVSKVYRTDRIETLALDSVSLTIDEGEFVSVMGPSGCGKSTLLNLMGLLDEPSSGSILFDGDKVASYRDRDVARLRNEKVGFVFQEFHLINDLDAQGFAVNGQMPAGIVVGSGTALCPAMSVDQFSLIVTSGFLRGYLIDDVSSNLRLAGDDPQIKEVR